MEYLKEYASNIVIISVLSTIFEIIIPEGKNKKTAGVVIGLVVMLTVMDPLKHIIQIKSGNLFPAFEIEESDTDYEKNLVADVFEENLAITIEEKTKETLQRDITCKVITSRNDVGEITEIESVNINPFDDETANFIEKEFGFHEGLVKGEKND